MGFGEMSDEEQTNAMLFVILALSTECVLEGLLGGSSERFWIFHAISAALSIWGLSSGSTFAMQLASISGIVNFLNELEMVWEFENRARMITPSFVLLAASATLGWKVLGQAGNLSRRHDKSLNKLESEVICLRVLNLTLFFLARFWLFIVWRLVGGSK